MDNEQKLIYKELGANLGRAISLSVDSAELREIASAIKANTEEFKSACIAFNAANAACGITEIKPEIRIDAPQISVVIPEHIPPSIHLDVKTPEQLPPNVTVNMPDRAFLSIAASISSVKLSLDSKNKLLLGFLIIECISLMGAGLAFFTLMEEFIRWKSNH